MVNPSIKDYSVEYSKTLKVVSGIPIIQTEDFIGDKYDPVILLRANKKSGAIILGNDLREDFDFIVQCNEIQFCIRNDVIERIELKSIIHDTEDRLQMKWLSDRGRL